MIFKLLTLAYYEAITGFINYFFCCQIILITYNNGIIVLNLLNSMLNIRYQYRLLLNLLLVLEDRFNLLLTRTYWFC